MNIESNVSKISEQMALYQTLSLVLLVIAVIFAIAAIVFWFVFKIPHSFKVLTGIGAGKELQKIKSDTKAGVANMAAGDNKAVLNWTTSSFSKPSVSTASQPSGSEETQLLTDVYDGSEETQLLSEFFNNSEETQVLNNSGFEIEEDIKFTGADELL